MQYLLLGALICLFFISYYFSGRDFFAPMTMQVIVFIFTNMMCIYLLSNLDYKIHLYTVWMIISCLTLSVGIGIFIHSVFLRIRVHPSSNTIQTISPISMKMHIIVIFLVVITLLWQLREVRRVGGTAGGFYAIMHAYRVYNSHTASLEAQRPMLLKQLFNFVSVFTQIYGINMTLFYRILSRRDRICNIIVLLLCITTQFLTGGRGAVVNSFIACVVVYHLFRLQKMGRYQTYSIRFLLRIIIILCGVLWLFSSVRYFIGRYTNKLNTLDYIAYYTGTEIVNLDLYLANPPAPPKIFGEYTFYTLIDNLRELGLLDINYYTIHQEFRTLHGVSLGNVYTALRIYHHDFGMFGLYILHGLVSVIFSVAYEYIKKMRGNLGIIFFAMAYYCIVITFFAERFFSTYLCAGTMIRIVLVLIMYKILFQKTVRVRLRRRAL